MSAPNPNPSDLDALRRAQRAHEPSMEEILASIRSIIADDRDPAAKPAPTKPAPAPAGPQIVYSKDSATPTRPVSEARAETPPAPVEPAAPKVVWGQPSAGTAVAVASPPPPQPAAEEESLLSAQTNEAVSSAFDALSASLALQSAELAETMTREILRPMLKTWLDENLPSMVERLVRAEIQRVARGGR